MEFIVLSLLEYYLFSFGLSATKRLVSHKLILKTGIKMNTLIKFSAILFPGFSLTRSQGFFCTRSRESNPRTKLVFEQRQTQVKSPFTFASCLPLVNCYKLN